MPRARKTQSGAAAQPVTVVTGQPYGSGVQQAALQQAMPAPKATSLPAQAGPAAMPVQQPAPAAAVNPAAVDPMVAAQALQGRTGLLTNPTARPMEPVTTGLTRGPGAGPEALTGPVGSPLGDTLRMLSNTLGDPYFQSLAQKANL